MDNIDFIKEHYADQIQAFNWLIEERFNALPNADSSLLRFGGGTALAMYHFQHRLSFDIDLFAVDAQILGYFSPKVWLEESRYFKSDDYIDQSNHVGFLSHNGIKVDILISTNLSENHFIDSSREIFPIDIYVEDIKDILAKKIVFRSGQNKTRDIIDIAVSLSHDKRIIADMVRSDLIKPEDLLILKSSLEKLDREKFAYETEIVAPFGEYQKIAEAAPGILADEIKNILSSEQIFQIALLSNGSLNDALFEVNKLNGADSESKPKP